jgi:hypothetical protein
MLASKLTKAFSESRNYIRTQRFRIKPQNIIRSPKSRKSIIGNWHKRASWWNTAIENARYSEFAKLNIAGNIKIISNIQKTARVPKFDCKSSRQPIFEFLDSIAILRHQTAEPFQPIFRKNRKNRKRLSIYRCEYRCFASETD